ncbi:hypothetical protein FIBSPDRAFT_973907 [Athelia psychrophila]|uniref:Uncharacterized protein n=1 Tax=Athelia psychrophila TaxID=1759441 RepID=A0A166FVB9_9AGAM|nr:hypothetical protein FIBSPDRAFT_973907 [Fibularhizoctonia sp. CBS 109695]
MASAYWAAFAPAFIRDSQAGFAAEFARLAAQKRWNPRSKAWRRERIRCYSQEFEALYGASDKLEGWVLLCAEVGAKEIPASKTQAKKILNRTWVNLVDLMECRATANPVFTHRSRNALRDYTIEEDKIFPKKAAKNNGFLSVLLIHVFSS